ncbi:MAG TPA: hypothetical protein VK166_18215 [Chitinophagaceae bacterium]|nr:hypothetical protein [Chitinophagaceae bacterium]
MKKVFILLLISISFAGVANAQKWADLSNEQKISKLQDFRADNQKYMKEKLGLTDEQRTDVDNVNLCFLSTLDLIDRYGKDDAAKEKYAKSAVNARNVQLDAIMGPEKRKQFQDYVVAKLKKAEAAQK